MLYPLSYRGTFKSYYSNAGRLAQGEARALPGRRSGITLATKWVEKTIQALDIRKVAA